jgi:hypothetical protein
MLAPALKKQGVDGRCGPAVSSTAMAGWADGSLAMIVGIGGGAANLSFPMEFKPVKCLEVCGDDRQ